MIGAERVEVTEACCERCEEGGCDDDKEVPERGGVEVAIALERLDRFYWKSRRLGMRRRATFDSKVVAHDVKTCIPL